MKTKLQLAENIHDPDYFWGRVQGHPDTLLTCEDFQTELSASKFFEGSDTCCSTCHTYTPYDMSLIETPRGWAWVCDHVKWMLVPGSYHDPIDPNTPEGRLLRAIFGEDV